MIDYGLVSGLSSLLKGDPGPARRPPPPTRFEKNYWFVFVYFDRITRIYVDFSQKTMLKLCILFTTLATNT